MANFLYKHTKGKKTRNNFLLPQASMLLLILIVTLNLNI